MRFFYENKKRAFTLIETMLVVAISAVVIGSLWQVFSDQTTFYTFNMARTELEKDALVAISHIQRDLRMAKGEVKGMQNRIQMQTFKKADMDDYEEVASQNTDIIDYQVDDNYKLVKTHITTDAEGNSVTDVRPIANNILYMKLAPIKNNVDQEEEGCPFSVEFADDPEQDKKLETKYGANWADVKSNQEKAIEEWHQEKQLMNDLAAAGLTVPKLDATSVVVAIIAGKVINVRAEDRIVTKEVITRVYMRNAIFSELEPSWIDNEKLMAGKATGINLAALLAALAGDLSNLSVEQLLALREDVKEALKDARDDYESILEEEQQLLTEIENMNRKIADIERKIRRCRWYQWKKKEGLKQAKKALVEARNTMKEEVAEITNVKNDLAQNIVKLEQGLAKIDLELRKRIQEANSGS
jgi:prepilin-type N-terminal cleavage/methylation domain-containing protein